MPSEIAGPEPVIRVEGRAALLAQPNIDTDQIIPARFLTTTERGALAAACFADWRISGPDNPIDEAIARGATLLLAAENFGCGSSREHAPWALHDAGFRAVVTPKAADIFKSNAAKNGLVVAEIGDAAWRALADRAADDPDAEFAVDLESLTVTGGDLSAPFSLEPFARTCLMEGVDPLGFILSQTEAIQRFEAANGK
jgi:3-isopropylmalate/(R)-2-methylmalate dehydratase small subunit